MSTAGFDDWVAQARRVLIEAELSERGIKLKGGTERVGPCPKCGGTDRFSINTTKQLWNCRGCGVGGDVIALVQHLDACDFIRACETLTGEPPPKNGKDPAAEAKKVVAAEHAYHDEAGALVFVTERVEYKNPDGSFVHTEQGKRKKSFRQKRPDPDRPGEWIWNTNGVRVLPYRLPELLEAVATDRTVIIVEGERKVDLLRTWNLPATCNVGGAGKWKREHSEFLRGADVVIVPDNDAVGREHADVVAASLNGIAARVRLLALPGLGPKGDIVDWAAASGTVEQLHELIEDRARPWRPQAEQTQEQPPTADLGEWDAGDDTEIPPPRGWLLGNTFCRGYVSSLFGPGAIGKTALRYAQAMSLAIKRPLTGEYVFQRARVLIVSLEDGTKELRRRILAARLHHKVDRSELKGWLFLSAPGGAGGKLLTIDQAGRSSRGELAAKIEAVIVKRQIDLVILDPFVKCHSVEENNNSLIDEVVQILSDMPPSTTSRSTSHTTHPKDNPTPATSTVAAAPVQCQPPGGSSIPPRP